MCCMQVTQADRIPNGRLISALALAEGHYADAFHVTLPRAVDLTTFVAAFYTTPLFKAERFVLRLFARAPTTDADAVYLAEGLSDQFAVWTVEGRNGTEILLGDKSGRTKSWLCVEPAGGETVLWFGSVVVPVMQRGKPTLGPVFDSLLGAHKLYSRMLLAAAAKRIVWQGQLASKPQ